MDTLENRAIIEELKKEFNTPRQIRAHKSNELHLYCRVVDDYRTRGMNMNDAIISAKQKMYTLYGITIGGSVKK